MTDTAIQAGALGRKFGWRPHWALRDCTFRLPAGRICAVVGPNGAGKTTLLALAGGLLAPTEGDIAVLGTDPASARARVGFVGQGKPLYPQLTVAETLRMGAGLNPKRWDAATAERIVADGGLDPKSRIRALSGGQRTRVALALALAKRTELLLLDEPMADLDPLARHELMGALMAQAAQHGTTIMMTSHVVAELENACDHLLLIGDGRVRLAGGIDDLLDAHTRVTAAAPSAASGESSEVTGPAGQGAAPRAQDTAIAGLAPHTVVESRTTGRQLTALIRPAGPPAADWRTSTPSLEELVLAYLRNPQAPALTTAPAKTEETVA